LSKSTAISRDILNGLSITCGMQKRAGLRVIISPLDWGLGHATRCIPVIRALLKQGAEVILMGSDNVLNRLSIEFPSLERIVTNDYRIYYSTWLPAYFSIALKSLSISKSERISYIQLQDVIKNRRIDLVVSDNRYYFRSDDVYSVIISHQIKPRLPFLNGLFGGMLQNFIAKKLHKFDEIWIPDIEGSCNLSGALSESNHLKKPVKYIGWLSRFEQTRVISFNPTHVVLVASGPEPQQSMLIDLFVNIFSDSTAALTIICPKQYTRVNNSNTHIKLVVSPSDSDFEITLSDASLIVMRSGYSSVMDLLKLGRRALLIPTPGQTEQEYLGHQLKEFGFSCMTQRELRKITSPEGLIKPKEPKSEIVVDDLLSSCVKTLIDQINRCE